MKQSSHTNQCRSLHKFFIYAIWILDLLRYIPPKLHLCGLRHEPPILDGDGDIVSNLKSASVFERFPRFMWFNWKAIQIKHNHVRYSGGGASYCNLILPVFALEWHPETVTQMHPIFEVGGGCEVTSSS
jgi:hypothetical protein